MNNIIFTLTTGLAIFLTNPVIAMLFGEEIDRSNQILQLKSYQMPAYETLIQCERWYQGNSPKIDFNILNVKNEKIGELFIDYYPENIKFYKTATKPVVRLRRIEIEQDYQRKYHGTRAMETLIDTLCKSSLFPENSEMWLEYSSWHPHLKKFYESFGFEEANELAAFNTKIMKLELNKAKFPYSAKLKEKK